MNSIDNLDLIKPLLSFDSELDFYWVKILKRKKDCPDDIKNTTQSVRTIKNYYVSSLEYLEDKYSEITELCSHFSARAYIELNTKNHKSVTLKMLSLLSDKIGYEQYNQSHLFEKAIGLSSSKDKKFILDIDDKDETTMNKIKKN